MLERKHCPIWQWSRATRRADRGTGPSHGIDRITPVRRREIRRALRYLVRISEKARIMPILSISALFHDPYSFSRVPLCDATFGAFPSLPHILRISCPPLSFAIARKATDPLSPLLVVGSRLGRGFTPRSSRGTERGTCCTVYSHAPTPALGRPHFGKATRPYGGHTLPSFLRPLANLPVSGVLLPPRVAQRHQQKAIPSTEGCAPGPASHPRLQPALTISSGYPCETATNAPLLSWPGGGGDGMRECSSATERSGWQHS